MDEKRFKLISSMDETSELSSIVNNIRRGVANTAKMLKSSTNFLTNRWNEEIVKCESAPRVETFEGDIKHDFETESNLIVKGNILPGCTVRCSSSLTVEGTIKAADIYCTGNLTALKGIDSSRNNTIDVRGKIKTQFVRNASIECYKSVTIIEDAIDSAIISRDNISVGGKICGGNLSAVTGVTAENIEPADASHETTKISVGIHYKLVQLLDDMSKEIAEINDKCNILRNIIKKYETKEKYDVDSLTYKERKYLSNLKSSLRNLFYRQVSGLKSRQDLLRKRVEKNRKATICVKKSVAAGTTLQFQERTIMTSKTLFGLSLSQEQTVF